MILTPRWTELKYHEKQQKYWQSIARFNVVPSGRRSGKTELAKRRLVFRAIHCRDHIIWPDLKPAPGVVPSPFTDPKFFAGAPTWRQVTDLFWKDLKALIPPWALLNKPGVKAINETIKTIKLFNGAEITLFGMDKPERIEGQPWDGGVLDEYGNMKQRTWPEHVRPALSDRRGWCDFIGVPEGRNHYYDIAEYSKKVEIEAIKEGQIPEWAYHHWISEDILPPEEIAALKDSLDELTYRQEMLGDFIYFQGRVYYPFDYRIHCSNHLKYDPKAPLIFCFDFNISPGVVAICQEQVMPGIFETYTNDYNEEKEKPVVGTGVIGEVYIPKNSNTVAICNRLMVDWDTHEGEIHIYGDATGGVGGSAQIAGSDWDIVRKMFRNKWENRTYYFIPTYNPTQRGRINAVNSRLMSTTGLIRMMVDPQKAPYMVKDLEGVRLLEGGSGEIDKKADPMLSHISDALGYYVAYRFPVEEMRGTSFELMW